MKYIRISKEAYKPGLCPACLSKVEWEDAYFEREDWNWYGMAYWFDCPHCGAQWSIEYTIDHAELVKEN